MKTPLNRLSRPLRAAWLLPLALLIGCPSSSDDHDDHEHDSHSHQAGEGSEEHHGDESGEDHAGHDHDKEGSR